MAYIYNDVADKLKFKGKDVKGVKHSALYLIQIITQGQDFANYPNDSKVLSILSDVLLYLQEKLPKALPQAEKMRLILIREQTLQAVANYQKTPSKENENLTTTLQKTLTQFTKDANISANISITVETLIQDDFWSRTHIPEVPRIDGKMVTVEEYMDAKKL